MEKTIHFRLEELRKARHITQQTIAKIRLSAKNKRV